MSEGDVSSADGKRSRQHPRRENRIAAMQILYMLEAGRDVDIDVIVRQHIEDQDHPRDYYAFAEELVYGTWERLPEIDAVLRDNVRNWAFQRIARVELAILRMAIYELKWRPDIPPVVSINEAIDLGKAFSNEDAKRFINGVLDRVRETLDRPARSPAI